jgi:minor extracellular protease Epr
MRWNGKKLMALLISLSMSIGTVGNLYADAIETKETESIRTEETEEYIVMAKTNKASSRIEEEVGVENDEYTELSNDENINIVEITEQKAQELEKDKDVVNIEKNIYLSGSGEALDPKEVDSDWNLQMINAGECDEDKAKDKIKVAIIDSGVDECDGIEVVKRINLIPDESEVISCFDDVTGHGTAIAGIIAGQNVEERECQGINSNAELYSIKVLDGDNTAPLSRVIEGIYVAIDNDVDIINMSFGTTVNSEILHKAVQDAYDKGILMIAAAGNRGENDGTVEYPAAYDEVMSVGSVNAKGEIAESSSIGDKVDVLAPGEYVKTVANFGFETVGNGTSMAVPHVVGVATVLWQKDKTKSADFIRGLIEETANSIKDNEEQYGIVDLKYALEKYDEYANNYNNKTYKMKSNDTDLNINTDMEKVTARWSKDNHEALITNNKNTNLTKKEVNMIKAGIRYNDLNLRKKEGEEYRYMWHSTNREANFMSAIFYVGKVIQEDNCNPDNVERTPGLTVGQYKQMKKDIKSINWKNVNDIKVVSDESAYPDNIKNRRLLLFGMELHIVTDAFAHKAYKRKDYLDGRQWSHWEHIGSGDTKDTHDTDNIDIVPSRYKAAGIIVKNAMNQCLRFSSDSVVMKKTYTIRSKQIAYNNTYLDGSYLIMRMVLNAEKNKENDNTYENYKVKLASVTYSNDSEEQDRIIAIAGGEE